jgi:arabinose-5-phosphate isomerase
VVIERARKALRIEAQAVLDLVDRIDERFVQTVTILFECQGKVMVTGMGKSGLVGKKIASTLSSTGTPAFFLHPAEGLNGDLGILGRQDVVMAISNSGETEEVANLLPLIKRFGNRLIVMTSHPESTIAKAADVVLDIAVREEACPLGLAPTATTTATLALGDAVAVSLMEKRGFDEKDFAALHPGGSLGKRLLLTVRELMHVGDSFPMVREDTPMKEALFEITSKRLGVTGVSDQSGRLVGVITDGDLRRGLERLPDLLDRKAAEVMTRSPKGIQALALAAQAVQKMEEFSITSLFVYQDLNDGRPVGIVHLHDLLKAGVV